MKQPLIGRIRGTSAFMRSLAAAVLVTFTMLILQPAAMAARAAIADQRRQAALQATDEGKLSETVRKVGKHFAELARELEKGETTGAEEESLAALREQVASLSDSVLQNFDEIGKHIREHNLAPVILERHRAAVAHYKKEVSALVSDMDAVLAAGSPEEKRALVQKARKQLAGQKLKRAQQPFDPNDLPFKSLKTKPGKHKPKLTKDEFAAAGLFDNPPVRLAALGDFTFDKLAGATNPDYLADTPEIRLSDAVKAKAAELGYDPVRIFRWVRNNVEWQPTWGAMQDADLTLSAQRGNAFDIASLTIALLRASGIPSRYVHGTIEVPADKFRNWAGGFESISAALTYAASGGIPAAGVVEGGRITKVQMEHIWVEAAIDYQPSRGAVNLDADSWVQMDPSFKQYEYLKGIDPIAISGLDPQALAQQFVDSGTVNEQEGWVSGFDPTILQNAQTQAQQAVEDYVANNMIDPTVGDVIGGRETILQEYPNLPSSLPNRILVTGTRYAKLPESLEHRMGFAFGTDILGDPVGLVSYPMPEVNNRKITLSFRPATAADEEALKSLLPDGEITDLSQLPSSIPSYLVNVVPELAIDGKVVSTGSSMALGEDLPFMFYVTLRGYGTTPYQYKVPAGAYLSIASIGGNVSAARLRALQSRVDATRTKLQSGDAGLIGSLSREDLLGDMFYTGTLGYFAQYLGLGHVIGVQKDAHQYLFAGYGSYGYEPKISYLFGFPRAIQPGGAVMNVRLTTVTGNSTGDAALQRDFSLQTGLLSSTLEHAVPEQMFFSLQQSTDGISAVKALMEARDAGQRIYHITPANQSATLPNIHHDPGTMSEILEAVASGKEVLTHTDAVAVSGWRGAGYIIFDPDSGSGAYKISGGQNGGYFAGFGLGFALGALMFALGASLVGGAVGPWALLLAGVMLYLVTVISIYLTLSQIFATNDRYAACLRLGFVDGVSTIPKLFKKILPNLVETVVSMIAKAFGMVRALDPNLTKEDCVG